MKKKTLINTASAVLLCGSIAVAIFAVGPSGSRNTAPPEFFYSAATVRAIPSSPEMTSLEAAEPEKKPATKKPAIGRQTIAERLASALSESEQEHLLELLNKGTVKELSIIDGIGKTRGEAIHKSRPFESIVELKNVEGIGRVTYERAIEHAKKLLAGGVEKQVVASN